ncbi:MAG: phosphoglycerate kinase [Candidatus Saccharimonadales bacterium]
MFTKQTVRDIDVKDKTVLVRVDFNVPLDEHGVITDDYRIRQALPTIEHLLGSGAKVVLASHLGRPTGPGDAANSLAACARRLSDLLHLPVTFVSDCIGEERNAKVAELQPGSVLLLENLRFHKEEEANDDSFAKALAAGVDYFVQDGFGVVHRAHASTEAITHHVPSVAGFLLEREVDTITNAMESPDRPLAVVIGGAKISDKIELLDIFIERADYIAVVGAMANTFLLAEGHQIGSSLVEKEAIDTAKQIIEKAEARMQKEHFTFQLPRDVVVAQKIDATLPTRVVDISSHTWADISSYPKQPDQAAYTVHQDEWILDIGPMTAAAIAGALSLAHTAVWNGTAGVTETKGLNGAADPYAHGTKIIADALVGERAGLKNKPFTVVGGGDTVGFVESIPGLRERLDHVSTGGGASLELMAGKKLPGVEALLDKNASVNSTSDGSI